MRTPLVFAGDGKRAPERTFLWLGSRDSNPNYLGQNQASYR
jgi:hypothetical protein